MKRRSKRKRGTNPKGKSAPPYPREFRLKLVRLGWGLIGSVGIFPCSYSIEVHHDMLPLFDEKTGR